MLVLKAHEEPTTWVVLPYKAEFSGHVTTVRYPKAEVGRVAFLCAARR